MNFIFAKLFKEYSRKESAPEYKIVAYISIFYFFLLFNLLLPLNSFIDKNVLTNEIDYKKDTITIIVFVLLGIILFIVYYVYITKKYIYKLVVKYNKTRINIVLLYIIVALTPALMLLTASITTVYINGGEILGKEIKGLLEK